MCTRQGKVTYHRVTISRQHHYNSYNNQMTLDTWWGQAEVLHTSPIKFSNMQSSPPIALHGFHLATTTGGPQCSSTGGTKLGSCGSSRESSPLEGRTVDGSTFKESSCTSKSSSEVGLVGPSLWWNKGESNSWTLFDPSLLSRRGAHDWCALPAP